MVTLDAALIAVDVALGVGAVALLVASATSRTGRRHALVLVLLLAGWVAIAITVGNALPVEAFQPLREGFSTDDLRMAAGLDEDVGRLPELLWRGWSCLGPRSLREAVTVSVLAAGWTAIGLGALALALVPDRRLALLVTLGFALSPAWLVAATGPLHAPIAGVYLVFAAACVALAHDATSPRWARGLAGALALLVAVVLGAIRPELGAVSLPLAIAVLGGRWGTTVEARIAALGGWTPRRVAIVVVGIAGWLALAAAIPARPPPYTWGELQWIAAGLHPLSPHGLVLPIVLLGMLPLGLVLLALRGAAWSLARPLRTGLLPLALWAMFVTVRTAAHGRVPLLGPGQVSPFELYRYLLALMPVVAVLAVLGARALSTSSPVARVVVGLLCLLPAIPSVTRLLDVDGGPGADWPARFGFTRDPQVEIRAIARRLEAAPTCGVVTLGHAWGGPPGPARFGWAALVPNGDGSFRFRPSDLSVDTDAATAAHALLGDVPCAVAWRSLDCAEVHGPGCAPLDALPVLQAMSPPPRPFVHPVHGGRWAPPLVIGWVAIPGFDPG